MADQIRGMPVDEALNLLTYSDKKAAALIRKVLLSAVANAENNEGADIDELKVTKIFVDEGATHRRFQARGKSALCLRHWRGQPDDRAADHRLHHCHGVAHGIAHGRMLMKDFKVQLIRPPIPV